MVSCKNDFLGFQNGNPSGSFQSLRGFIDENDVKNHPFQMMR